MDAPTILFYGDHFIQDILQKLPADPLAIVNKPGACGRWSIKDIIAHLSSEELVLYDVLKNVRKGEPQPIGEYLSLYSNKAHNFNDSEVSKRAKLSWQDTLAEYAIAVEKNLLEAQQISADQFALAGTLPWYGSEYSLDDYIVYSNYGHKREHGAQIDVFISQ